MSIEVSFTNEQLRVILCAVSYVLLGIISVFITRQATYKPNQKYNNDIGCSLVFSFLFGFAITPIVTVGLLFLWVFNMFGALLSIGLDKKS